MKKKSFVLNLIYLILIVFLYIIGSKLLNNEFDKFTNTFKYYFLNITIIYLVFFGGIGVVLELDKFFKEKNKMGKWKVNLYTLILLGVPSLIFSISLLIPIILPFTMKYSNTLYIASNIILGHTLISSIYKEDCVNIENISL